MTTKEPVDDRDHATEPVRPSTWIGLFLVVLIGATYVLFSGAVRNGFVIWDDELYVYGNHHIRSLGPASIAWLFTHSYFASWTPLTLLSHAIDYAVWHLDPRGHHLTSVLLHSLNAGWVFLLTLLLLVRSRQARSASEAPASARQEFSPTLIAASLLAAVLFAIHPLRVESAAWVSDRKDLLCAFFILPATIAYLLFADRRRTSHRVRWYAVSLLLFALALLSKSIAVTWPVVLLLLDVFVLRPTTWRAELREMIMEKIPFLLMSVGVGVVAMLSAPGGETSDFLTGLSPVSKSLFFTFNIVFYLLKEVWPVGLAATYEPPSALIILGSVIVTGAVTAACIALARRHYRYPLAAWLCYLVLLLPSMGVVRSIIQPTADRYSYLPMLAFVPPTAVVFDRLLQAGTSSRIVAVIASAAVLLTIVVLGVLSRVQVERWFNSERLWRHAVEVSPRIPFPYYNLGLALHEKGDLASAMQYYRTAVALKPSYPEPHNNMGNVYRAWGDTAKALDEFRLALKYKPDLIAAYINLGSVYLARNAIDTAVQFYRKASALEPENPDAVFHLGYAYYTGGDLSKALELFQKVVGLDPVHQRAYVNMGAVYLRQGNTQAALEAFRHAARLGNLEAMRFLVERGVEW